MKDKIKTMEEKLKNGGFPQYPKRPGTEKDSNEMKLMKDQKQSLLKRMEEMNGTIIEQNLKIEDLENENHKIRMQRA